jgi:hypothetical protein
MIRLENKRHHGAVIQIDSLVAAMGSQYADPRILAE